MTGQLTARDVRVRPLAETDLVEADRVMRLAFGTFLGLPDPMAFMGDGDCVRSRWRADRGAALAAEADGQVVGSNFATRWGSVGYFGPLTVHPSLWDRGIARRLLASTMEIVDGWGLSHAGLFTFGHSPKHIALYQAFGFLPRFLTAVLSAPISPQTARAAGWTTYSAAPDRAGQLADCVVLTDTIYPGLDVSRELLVCHDQVRGGACGRRLRAAGGSLRGVRRQPRGRPAGRGDEHRPPRRLSHPAPAQVRRRPHRCHDAP
ncbi:MAG: GNAT family N-acetyltransferase, partial [Pseudonocardiaceae bacterium]